MSEQCIYKSPGVAESSRSLNQIMDSPNLEEGQRKRFVGDRELQRSNEFLVCNGGIPKTRLNNPNARNVAID